MGHSMAAFLEGPQNEDTKVAHEKLGTNFFLPDAISMIQVSVCSSCVGLQLGAGTKNYYQSVPEIHTSEVADYFNVYLHGGLW